MHILKFGGTSLGNAERILSVLNIINDRSQITRVGVVVSAIAGVTNYLFDSTQKAVEGVEISKLIAPFYLKHEEIIINLAKQKTKLAEQELSRYLDETSREYRSLLHGIQLIKSCPDNVYNQILSLGERMSVRILHALLVADQKEVELLDSCNYIKTKGELHEGVPIMEEITQRFSRFKQKGAKILLMAGFIASNREGKLTLLGRNGSDYSAALMAAALQTECCEIWTDVDGIYTADPRLVADAKLIAEMRYGEAMELSFYGAKILHPKTIAPLAAVRIPIWVRNSLNLNAPGTKIYHDVKENNKPICGISCLENIALVNIYGPGMRGAPGIAARIFTAVSRRNISIILITQSSSEYSVCFCIAENDILLVKETLSEEFALEMKAQLIENIDVQSKQAIICIVGDGMRARRGIAGRFFSALASADINVVAISQGSSERSISAVVDGNDGVRATNVTHRFFFKTLQSIEVFLVGPGAVGSQLLEQMRLRQKELLSQNLDIQVHGIIDSKRMLLSTNGLELKDWQDQLKNSEKFSNISAIFEHVQTEKLLGAVLVDCTSSENIAQIYLEAFKQRLHIVTANKKANTSGEAYYKQLRDSANKHHRCFLYETNVGAGLPIIDTLQNLIKCGDNLLQFTGILSGALSFIFGLLEKEVPFSQAVTIARDKKFTEPDPRDDLSGVDVARKLLILSRESGIQLELEDINILSLFPKDFDLNGDVDEFLDRLKTLDDYFYTRVKSLKENNKIMRYVGEINQGKCQVGIIEVDKDHFLAPIKEGENAFAFLTQRYSPIPLVIRGYGAGTDVTAAGVFSDILRTVQRNAPEGHDYEN